MHRFIGTQETPILYDKENMILSTNNTFISIFRYLYHLCKSLEGFHSLFQSSNGNIDVILMHVAHNDFEKINSSSNVNHKFKESIHAWLITGNRNHHYNNTTWNTFFSCWNQMKQMNHSNHKLTGRQSIQSLQCHWNDKICKTNHNKMLCIFNGMYCNNHISVTHYPDFYRIVKGTLCI